MTIRLEPKRADEVRDYRHDWSPFLGEDTINTLVTTGTGVTVDDADTEAGDQSVVMWLSGGTNGETATITQTITTVGGRAEVELFVLPIMASEVITLAQAKDYLRIRHSDEDSKIAAMIPRAQAWVEDHTGLALTQREFTERRLPRHGSIRLDKGPLVSLDEIAYTDADGAQTYTGRAFAPSTTIFPATSGSWPTLSDNNEFEVTYTAGFAPGEVDERLIGAVLGLIEGEYAEGYAYPQRATDAAERCCAYLRAVV